jgi:hypothetical protein
LRANPTGSAVFATRSIALWRGQLIDIINGRSRKVLADRLTERLCGWIARISPA